MAPNGHGPTKSNPISLRARALNTLFPAVLGFWTAYTVLPPCRGVLTFKLVRPWGHPLEIIPQPSPGLSFPAFQVCFLVLQLFFNARGFPVLLVAPPPPRLPTFRRLVTVVRFNGRPSFFWVHPDWSPGKGAKPGFRPLLRAPKICFVLAARSVFSPSPERLRF